MATPPPAVWNAPAIIGTFFGGWGFVMSGVFLFFGLEGFREKNPPKPNLGEPWTAWIQAGLDGSTNRSMPDDDPLEGASGPMPDIYLFNDVGHYLGRPLNKNVYVRSNTVRDVNVYPNNIQKDEGQDATIAVLSARDHHRDGLLITEIAFGFREDKAIRPTPYGINGLTFLSCGAPWYPSGILKRRQGGDPIYMPGFWLGGEHGLGAIQIHGPTHTYGKSSVDFEKYNASSGKKIDEDELRREMCEHPARLAFYKDPIPEKNVRNVFLDFDLVEDRTRSVTAPREGRLRCPGRPGPCPGGEDDPEDDPDDDDDDDDEEEEEDDEFSPRSKLITARSQARSSSSSSTPVPAGAPRHKMLTIVDDETIGLSAKQVCRSRTSAGPDYVNIPEGQFCRMEDRKLFPLCQGRGDGGERSSRADAEGAATAYLFAEKEVVVDDGSCFDLETRRIGSRLPAPARPRPRPRQDAVVEERSWVVTESSPGGDYDGELRTGGEGWKYQPYR